MGVGQGFKGGRGEDEAYGIRMTFQRVQNFFFSQIPDLVSVMARSTESSTSRSPCCWWSMCEPAGTDLDLIIDPTDKTNPAFPAPFHSGHTSAQPIVQLGHRASLPILETRRIPYPGDPIVPPGEDQILPARCRVCDGDGIDDSIMGVIFRQPGAGGEGGGDEGPIGRDGIEDGGVKGGEG
jgi:hypothetical protein